VRKFYKDAIPEIKRLAIDLINLDILEIIEEINNKIEVKSKGDKEVLK